MNQEQQKIRAAKARQQMSKEDNTENMYGLASVQAINIYTTEEIEERKRNKEKHMSIISAGN